MRKKILKYLSSNQFGSGKGFSSYLSDLSEINVSNVWLEEISLSDNFVKLTGSALKAESVPEYFNLFKEKRLFNGRVFEVFEIQRKQDQDWKVDFLIASQAAANE